MRRIIAEAQEKSATQYNKKHLDGPRFREGDMVYISRKNIKTRRPTDKLDHRKIGPYPVDKQVGEVAYRIKLPKHLKIHPTFYVSLLEYAKGDQAKPYTPELADGRERKEFEVEQIQLFRET